MRFYVERTDFAERHYHYQRVSLLDTEDVSFNCSLEEFYNHPRREDIKQSMLTIGYVSRPWKSLKEGSWYNIPDRLLERFEYQLVTEDMPGGAFLRARLNGPSDEIDFTQYLDRQNNATTSHGGLPRLSSTPSNMQLIVVDCGQGNWNEVISDQDRVIYDIGASSQYNSSELSNLVNSRSLATETRPIYIILSHWDIDHYQGLLGCTPADLINIRTIIAPSQIPNTATYQRIYNILAANGKTISAIPPAARPAGTGRRIVLCMLASIGPYYFFRATAGRTRNQTGIVIMVNDQNHTAILTGDHHYEKIMNAILGIQTNSRGILVVPHHGAVSGRINYNRWNAKFPIMNTPISVGQNNPYGHPDPSILAILRQLQNGQPPDETRRQGNLTYFL